MLSLFPTANIFHENQKFNKIKSCYANWEPDLIADNEINRQQLLGLSCLMQAYRQTFQNPV